MGRVATVGTPVNCCNSSGAGASKAASPRNLFNTKPRIKARSSVGNKAQVPYRWAKAPPRSMSATSRQRACACTATRMFTMSLACKFISAGEPAPSITTTSWSARSASSDAMMCGHTWALRSRHGVLLNAMSTCPNTTTWLLVSASGFNNTGFMCTCGSQHAASAWKYWAEPISPSLPCNPATTRALLLMFCALKGATLKPMRA